MATLCLALTLVHTFNAGRFARFKNPYLHLLSEVEVIFAVWGLLYLILHFCLLPLESSLSWFEVISFSEPLFVLAIMVIASTRPILMLAHSCIQFIPGILPLPSRLKESRIPTLFSLMSIGPLLGSLITEPAAMTVSALLLHHEVLGSHPSKRLLYLSIATLFVNVSIGGVLTAFAAPPVLMVAKAWGWDTPFVFAHFGLHATIAVFLNAGVLVLFNQKELLKKRERPSEAAPKAPALLSVMNLILLCFTVLSAHHPKLLLLIFAVTFAALKLTSRYQGFLQLKSGALVGAFLAGLAILTADQAWWLTPVITKLGEGSLFIGSTLLTAITDNAALTSLAAQVKDLPHESRFFIVAGAVAGGGLTLIANAPNPAGYSILKTRFGNEGIQAKLLLGYALLPTLIAGALLWKHG